MLTMSFLMVTSLNQFIWFLLWSSMSFQESYYGLKQTLRNCYHKLSSSFLSLRFQNAKFDYSLFVKFSAQIVMFVMVYVDAIWVMTMILLLLHKLFLNWTTTLLLRICGVLVIFWILRLFLLLVSFTYDSKIMCRICWNLIGYKMSFLLQHQWLQ